MQVKLQRPSGRFREIKAADVAIALQTDEKARIEIIPREAEVQPWCPSLPKQKDIAFLRPIQGQSFAVPAQFRDGVEVTPDAIPTSWHITECINLEEIQNVGILPGGNESCRDESMHSACDPLTTKMTHRGIGSGKTNGR